MAMTETEVVITVLKRDAGGGIASYRYSGHHSRAACEKVYIIQYSKYILKHGSSSLLVRNMIYKYMYWINPKQRKYEVF